MGSISATISNIIMFLCSVVMVLKGIVLMAVVFYFMIKWKVHDIAEVFSTDVIMVNYVNYGVLILGVFIFFEGMIGLYGVMKKSKSVIFLFSFMLMCVIGCSVGFSVLTFEYRNTIEDTGHEIMLTTLKNGYDQEAESGADATVFSYSWDMLQVYMGCCGVDGPADWYSSKWANDTNATLYDHQQKWPFTCCASNRTLGDIIEEAAKGKLTKTHLTEQEAQICFSSTVEQLESFQNITSFVAGQPYDSGCFEKLTKLLGNLWNKIALVTAASVTMQMVLLGCSCYVAGSLDAKKDD